MANRSRADDETTDSIRDAVSDLYEAISFPAGGEPNWTALRSLFHPQAKVIPPARQGGSGFDPLTVEQFIESTKDFLKDTDRKKKGFVEREIANRIEIFGNVAHVFSTYEGLFHGSTKPFSRGINSIQLVFQNGRWSVMSILWDEERLENEIPDRYLEES